MRKPGLAEFKRFAAQHKSLAMAVVQAQAFAQVEQERVMAYIVPLFREYQFTCRHTGEALESPDQLYRSGNEDLCADFYKAADHAHREHGFTGPEGYWPNLVADNLRIKAESALIEAGCKWLNLGEVWDMEHRKRLLEILLGACLKRD